MSFRVSSRGGDATRRAPGGACDGFAAVDAMVALMILALTLILAVQAQVHAARMTVRAEEIGRADRLIGQLMQTPTDGYAPLEGAASGFAWTVSVQALDADLPVPICRREVRVVGGPEARVYRAATDEVCPLESLGA